MDLTALHELVEKSHKDNSERIESLEKKLDTVVEAVSKSEEKPPKKPERITVLEKIEDPKPAPMGNTHDDFLAGLRGFAVTN
jgi:hypothetical protein